MFSTNLNEKDLTDEAFLRRMGYRARVEPPTASAFSEIFKRAAYNRGIRCDQQVLDHLLTKYRVEQRVMKGCEPRDLLDRATDICLFEGQALELTTKVLDTAWRNYFGTSHSFANQDHAAKEKSLADPLEL